MTERAPELRDLAEDERRLLDWRYGDGLDTAAIARRLQATSACVATRLHRLRARLRQRLAG